MTAMSAITRDHGDPTTLSPALIPMIPMFIEDERGVPNQVPMFSGFERFDMLKTQ